MKTYKLVDKNKILSVLTVLLLFSGANAASAQDTDTWEYELNVYGWFAGIDGTVGFPSGPGSGADISVDVSDILDNLSMIFMGGMEAKRNKWSIIADVVYMNTKNTATRPVAAGPVPGVPVNAAISMDMVSWVVQGGVGYDVVQAEWGTFAVVGGVRYLTVDTDVVLGLQVPLPLAVGATESEGLLDGIVGVKGYIKLNDSWYLPYHADIGTGGSELSWQLFAGIGYRFGWGDIRLGYRVLNYDMEDDKLLQDLSMNGPILGAAFRF